MGIYSADNIEYIIKRLLRSEGASAIVSLQINSIQEEIKSHETRIKELKKELRGIKKDTPSSPKLREIDFAIKEIAEATDKCEERLEEEIREYAKKLLIGIRSKKIKPELKGFELFGKLTFTTNNLDSKVIEQLIKLDIAKYYKKKPANRDSIIEQLIGLLGNKLPKYIIRADIKSFFESVPFDSLLDKLEAEGYLSVSTLRYLRRIADETKKLGGEGGVPRGLAFSSYLTEIYLQRIDDEIKKLPRVYFYQRYVDDIIILVSVDTNLEWPHYINNVHTYWRKLKDIFGASELSLHEGRKKNLIYSGKSTNHEFEYLGYKFIINKGSLTIRLSKRRLTGYKNKIKSIVTHYNKTATDNQSLTDMPKEKGEKRRKRQPPLKRLFGQLSALTGNGMMKGPKSNILTGIYYSNKYLTSQEDLMELDEVLQKYVEKSLEIPDNLFRYTEDSDSQKTIRDIKQMILEKWSFVEGFKKRRFCNNPLYLSRLKQIKKLST